MELWDLVDKNGNKIGKIIERSQIHPEGTYHVGVDVWIINSKNNILIQKRSSNKRCEPNVWAMTGGSSLFGETTEETIVREAKEELGINLIQDRLQLVKKYPTGRVFVYEYLIRQDIDINDIVMKEDEVSAVKWATYDEIEEIYKKGLFMQNRWEYVRDIIKAEIEK